MVLVAQLILDQGWRSEGRHNRPIAMAECSVPGPVSDRNFPSLFIDCPRTRPALQLLSVPITAVAVGFRTHCLYACRGNFSLVSIVDFRNSNMFGGWPFAFAGQTAGRR